MALTGLLMVGFLLMHMVGNLKMFIGADSFNHYAEWLKGLTEDGGIAYPLLPKGWFIWLFRLVMIGAIVAHMYAAWALTVRDRAARGSNYVVTKRRVQTYSARTMRWGGVILAGFLVFHLLQFTVKAIRTDFSATDDPYTMFVKSFSGPMSFMVILYGLWLVSVCMHVRHAIWSACTTLGLNTSEGARGILNGLAMVVAVLLYIGFMAAPVACAFGWIK